jgi:RHS repeat-associated protein
LNETVSTSTRTYAWQYDQIYRLTNETVSGTAPTGTLGYGYDAVGNRTNRTSSVSGLVNQTPTYNTNDWLTTDSYDNNGNTTNSGINSYQYDVMNRLTNFNNGQVIITYDGDGNRAIKTVSGTTTYYLLDDRNPSGYVQVLEEWTATGTPGLNKVYNYGLDLISQRTLGSQLSTNYFIYDGHGSTRVLTDNGGNVTNVFTYDAFGNLIASNTTPQTTYLYCGQQYDTNFGLYYNRSRYLNPNTGRFWTMDTFEGDNEAPLTLHKYLYGGDNPVDNDDPSGHDYGDFSINLGSIYNLVLKDMLAQYDSATPDVMSGRNSSKPETFTIDKDPNPPGSQTFTAPGGETFLAPSGTDFRNVYKAGKAIPFKYDFAAIDRAVGHYGTFDYQRNKGQGEKLNNIFYTAYIHASNFGVGVYMNGAGYSLDGTITIASDFAGKSSSNAGDPNQKKWWTYGWNGAQSGNPGSSSH